MIILKVGDRLPSVAVAQNMLNQHGHSAEFIAVDGIYGPKTKRAVAAFERARGLTADGIISGTDWNQLVGRDWQVLDSVDATEYWDREHRILDHRDLKPYGQTVLVNYGMSNGLPDVLRRIQLSASAGNVVLLRFHGHGASGHMVVASGRTGRAQSSLVALDPGKFFAQMSTLKGIFAPFGSVEMHGCRVSQGHYGAAFIRGMADAFGVPVSASPGRQKGGGKSTFRFEGHVDTACPGGGTLKAWAEANCNRSLVPA